MENLKGESSYRLPGDGGQLLVVHVQVLLQLLRADEAPVTLITRPILLLFPQHWGGGGDMTGSEDTTPKEAALLSVMLD